MKKSAWYGALAGIGAFALAAAGIHVEELPLEAIAMMIGSALLVYGMTSFFKEIGEHE